MNVVEQMLVELREIVAGKRDLWSGRVVEAFARRSPGDFDLDRARGQLRRALEHGTGADVEAAVERLDVPRTSAQAAVEALDQLESRSWLLQLAAEATSPDLLAGRRPGEAIARARQRARARAVFSTWLPVLLDHSPPCQGYQGP
jgi:hypothetical protein